MEEMDKPQSTAEPGQRRIRVSINTEEKIAK